jgi:hypothetical protein
MNSTIFWDVTPCSPVEVNHVLEEHNASIFRDEEQAKQASKQPTNKKQAASKNQLTNSH